VSLAASNAALSGTAVSRSSMVMRIWLAIEGKLMERRPVFYLSLG
jgi:hypothetical protein